MNIEERVEKLKEENLFRSFKSLDGKHRSHVLWQGEEFINFGSNDYLGLAEDEKLSEVLIEGIKLYGNGSGASRLVTGNFSVHEALERALASFSKKEAALLFPSGFMANLGLIGGLVGEGDLLIFDKLNHASIIDGGKNASAKLRVFPHHDYDYLEKILLSQRAKFNSCWVITDSVFSMDGDFANLDRLVELKKKYGFYLVLDEAHGVGVLGQHGEGLAGDLGLSDYVDYKVGTLSKAFGLQGGYVAGTQLGIELLRNKGRTFIYTTGLPPFIAHGALYALQRIKEMDRERKELLKRAEKLRLDLQKLGWDTLNSMCQIIPLLVGDSGKLLEIEAALRKMGLLVPSIRYPTVKKGTERFRLSLTSKHSEADLDLLVQALALFREKL